MADLKKTIDGLVRSLKKGYAGAPDAMLALVEVLGLMEFTDVDLHHALRAKEALSGIVRDIYAGHAEDDRRRDAETKTRGYPRDSDEAGLLMSIKRSRARVKKFEKIGFQYLIESEGRLLAKLIGWLEAFRRAKSAEDHPGR